ncbi:MAG: CaiB/BaiF CoA-transferase family protein [Pseudomonadota bacterium]|nr:CaiB/BaiF CoA-transferase family protein [Pseudomonadota bacterium]
MSGKGPLAGVRVLELDSIGPGPFAAMLLADMGASVLRISRPPPAGRQFNPVTDRGRAGQLVLNLKTEPGRNRFIPLVERADVVIEGHRPGVMERLGLGPDYCLSLNPRLVYGRITGWGRSGPLAHAAGHDINYIALSGALYACGTSESGPVPPLNLVGDFGGGGLLLAFGVACAVAEVRDSGKGQVVDAAMTDGAATLMSMIYGMRATNRWSAPRAGNILDGSAYYYCCYRTSDDGWMAVGAIELPFRRLFLEKLGLGDELETILAGDDAAPESRSRIQAIFASAPRSHWQSVYEGSDACVSPVLSMDEVVDHPQNAAWGSFKRVDGAIHSTPAPRFSRTPTREDFHQAHDDLLEGWGLAPHEDVMRR